MRVLPTLTVACAALASRAAAEDDTLLNKKGTGLFVDATLATVEQCSVNCLYGIMAWSCIKDRDDYEQFKQRAEAAEIEDDILIPMFGTWLPDGSGGQFDAGETPSVSLYFGCGAVGDDYLDLWPNNMDYGQQMNQNIMTVLSKKNSGEWKYEQAALDTEALCLCTTDIVEGIQPIKGLDIDEGSYEPDEYVTTGTVNQLHSLYLTGSSDFDPTDLEYAKRIAAFFAFTIVFGVLSIIIMWCNGCCSNLNCHRHHCACCYRMGKRNGKILTIFVLLLSGGTMMGSYVGRQAFHDSVSDMSNLMRMVADVFEVIEGQTEIMAVGGASFVADAANSECGYESATAELATGATAFADSAQLLYGLVCPLDDEHCDDIAEGGECARTCLSVTMYDGADSFEDPEAGMPYFVDLGIMGLTAGCWSLALLAILASCTDCAWDDIILNILAAVVMMVTVVFCAFLITISVTVADFCAADPADTMVNVAADNGIETPMIPYYAQCVGTNPFSPQLNDTVMALEHLNNTCLILGSPIAYPDPTTSTIENAEPMCNAEAMRGLQAFTGTLKESVVAIGGLFECNVINPLLKQITDEIVCGSFLTGLYNMWVVLLVSAWLMWLAFMFMPMGNHEIVSEKTLAKRKAAKAKKAGGEAAAETSQVTLELAPVKENLTTI